MSTLRLPALKSSMNESVALVGGPELMRNSLILTGFTFRTFSTIVTDCSLSLVWFFHEALPIRSPLRGAGPEVTLNVALTLAPGATGPSNVFEVSELPATSADHCFGNSRLSFTRAAGAPVVFVKVTAV